MCIANPTENRRCEFSRIHRSESRHEFIDLTLTIALDGDFNTAYSEADNSKIVATDSMKNTVYVLASRHRNCID